MAGSTDSSIRAKIAFINFSCQNKNCDEIWGGVMIHPENAALQQFLGGAQRMSALIC
jgi:hypothetical protein